MFILQLPRDMCLDNGPATAERPCISSCWVHYFPQYLNQSRTHSTLPSFTNMAQLFTLKHNIPGPSTDLSLDISDVLCPFNRRVNTPEGTELPKSFCLPCPGSWLP